MSDLKAQIQSEIKNAMKAKAAERLSTLRLIWNAVRKKEIDDRKDLDDQDVQKLLLTMQKQTRESLEQAEGAGRDELAAEARAELTIVSEFLPKQLDEVELEKKVSNIKEKLLAAGELPEGARAMGAMMKACMAEVGGQAEGKLLQAAVKKVLGL